MGLDKNNIPDEYLCEKCSPRPVDRKRAKALQKAIAKEQKERFAKLRQQGQTGADSSDDDKKSGDKNNRKPFTTPGRKFGGKKALEKKLLEGKKLIKKTHKRSRTHRDSGARIGNNTESSSPGSPTKRTGQVKESPRKSLPRRSLSGSDAETDEAEESGPGETLSLR